jgi:hypothetical protein
MTDPWGNTTDPSSDYSSSDRNGDYFPPNSKGKHDGRYDYAPNDAAPYPPPNNGHPDDYRNQYDDSYGYGANGQGYSQSSGSQRQQQSHNGYSPGPVQSYPAGQPTGGPRMQQMWPEQPPPPPHADQYDIDFAPVNGYPLAQSLTAPVAPPKDYNPAPTRLNRQNTLSKQQGLPSRPNPPEKRKSWFKRLSTRG